MSHDLEASHQLGEIMLFPFSETCDGSPMACFSPNSWVRLWRPASVCSTLIPLFSTTVPWTLLFSKTRLIIFPGTQPNWPASTPIYKMPLPGIPSLFLLYPDFIITKAKSKSLPSSWPSQCVMDRGFAVNQANLGLSLRDTFWLTRRTYFYN